MSSGDSPNGPSGAMDGEDTTLKATYAGAKRRIATLELQLKALQEAGTKKKT
jgi:hypothetical protein